MVHTIARTKHRQSNTESKGTSERSSRVSRKPISPLALRAPTIQAKLTVNPPGDQYEQEADAIAARVTQAPITQPDEGRDLIQRQPEDESVQMQTEDESVQMQTEKDEPVQMQAEDESVQMQAAEENTVQMQTEADEPIQRKGTGTPTVSPATASTIRSPGAGSPLPAATRSRIEPHVGANLSGVRIHSGPSAHKATASLNARAFTHGNHIFLNRAESSSNLSLMAHESTHVVQQGAAPVQRLPLPTKPAPVQKKSAPSISSTGAEGVQRLPDFIVEELEDYTRYIPGYTLFTVLIGYDPIRGESVERSAINVIQGLMELTGPFGAYVFDALQEYNVLQPAFDWVSGELQRLNLSRERIEQIIENAWDNVRLAEGADYNIAVVRRHFQALYDDVVAFANSLVSHLIEMIKEAAIDFAEPLLAENKAWALIKKILHYDPLRDETVEASTVEILEDFLRLIGKEQELQQMQERGTLQETADWLDTQLATFTSLLGQLQEIISGVWNAIQPENLPELGTNIETLAVQVGNFLQGVWDFASTVALTVLELIKNALLGWLSTFADDIPGYHLLTVILGRNAFTQEEVPRNATNLIRGFMSLIPGGNQQFQQMQETGVIPQAAQRIEGMMSELGITWPFVQQLFVDVWNAFTIDDLIVPIDAFTRVLEQFREPLGRLFTFVIEVIKVALELILALMNFPTDLIGSIITNALQALDDIQQDPVGFLINLLNTAKLGFQNFFGNIAEHLIGGLTDWLFRAVREAGIEPPADLSFESILGFVLEVLGLTMDHMWELLAEHIGQEQVDQIRGAIDRVVELGGEAWAFIQEVQEKGIGAIWEYIESQLTGLWSTVLTQVQEYVMERVIMVGMRWLLSLLDATGITPVINSFIAFFNAIQSAIEYLRDMLAVVNDFVSTVASIAAGDIEPGAARMEEGLGNSVPIVIGFIANQLGLGNISDRLGQIIESIREMVDKALNWLIEQALNLGESILRTLGFSTESNEPVSSQNEDAGPETASEINLHESFSMSGENHTLYAVLRGERLSIKMASAQSEFLEELVANALEEAREAGNDSLADSLERLQKDGIPEAKIVSLSDIKIIEDLKYVQQGENTFLLKDIPYMLDIIKQILISLGDEHGIQSLADLNQNPIMLKNAVEAQGIVTFMEEISEKGESDGVSRDTFIRLYNSQEEVPTGNKGNTEKIREWLKNTFRAAWDGQHEWVPTNLIDKVVLRASDPVIFIGGVGWVNLWVNLQHELRSDTRWVVFKPTKKSKEVTDGGVKYTHLQGHVGAIYLDGVEQVDGQYDFHKKLEKAFEGKTRIDDCVENGIRPVFEKWVLYPNGGDDIDSLNFHKKLTSGKPENGYAIHENISAFKDSLNKHYEKTKENLNNGKKWMKQQK
ncbi:MAG: DUF4157 domain-containing protein [Cyanobacteria bacterium J06639_14]